ncbi:MAG TPA: SUMF1/EgtB/PvdO family nonheme iron enzyme, partial [Longilinea sp.]|nr:SUMF1/EgtB/PvdO family nonheme iron enzyme [Longilinea sp.]
MPTPRVLSLDCPKCGAPLKASTQAVECPYCHASLLVDLNQNEKTSSLPNRIIISDPLPLEMILIPGGEFLMGADPNVVDHNVNGCGPCGTTDEYPQHTVYVSDFYISKYPITWQQSALFMQRTGSKPSQGEAFIPFRDPQHARYYKWVEDARKDTNNGNRIEKITWDDSVKMNGWLSRLTGYSFDLPTEAEWEKAARGTDGRLFPWGNVLNAAYELDESDYLHSEDGKYCIEMPMIGSHSPVTDSPYGVSDMLTYLQWVKDQPNFEGYQGRVGKVVKDPYQKPGGAIEWFGKQLDPNTHLAKGKALYRPENPHIPESEAYLTVSARIFVMSTCAFRPVIRIKPLVPSVIEPKEKPQPTEIAPSQVENSQPLSERQNPVTPTISQGKVSLKLGDFAAAIDPIPVRAQSVKIITPLSNPNNAWTWHMPAAIYE